MTSSTRPKRALIAYCVLAERLRTPGRGIMQALTPFLAEACQQFAGELFDAGKLSDAVAHRYGIRIPRLAALGLAEQLATDGLLASISGDTKSIVYRYAKSPVLVDAIPSSPITETEVEAVLASFIEFCRTDTRLTERDDQSLETAFLDRLLNTDSMRILVRREASIYLKKTANTLVINKAKPHDQRESEELHLDFLVSQFLLDLRHNNLPAFERVSNVAFANMAAEAIACFREPVTSGTTLNTLTVYLDSPLLLDMLGVNAEYAEYGLELLEAIRASGAQAAVFDHCVAEAETAIHGQLSYLRSGINHVATRWGTTAKPDLLAALSGNVAERAEMRLGIAVHRDPEVNLHRRSQATVGTIEAAITARMQAWGNAEAKEHDRKSVWAMLAIRDSSAPCPRLCDCSWLLLTRNTALVAIANQAWGTWLQGSTKHSGAAIERWAPVAMSDKQFAGYLWARTGDSNTSISRARLLAHCSAAVRPRADVKTRAYNLVLELNGLEEADDVAALLEDREGANALMRATRGDPEDVTPERLPFILEAVKLAAGEFAASAVREESEQRAEAIRLQHEAEVEQVRAQAAASEAMRDHDARVAQAALLQQQQEREDLAAQNARLRDSLAAQAIAEKERKDRILDDGFASGKRLYKVCRWLTAGLFGIASGLVTQMSAPEPFLAACATVLLGTLGFWFVPELLDRPLSWLAMKRLRAIVTAKDANVVIPAAVPDFRRGIWTYSA